MKRHKKLVSWFFDFMAVDLTAVSLGTKVDLYQQLWVAVGGHGKLPLGDPDHLTQELCEVQSALKGYLDEIMSYKGKESSQLGFTNKDQLFVRVAGDEVFVSHGVVDMITMAKVIFIESLAAIPHCLSLIHNCRRPDCDNWFIKLTERPKYYCSPRCAAINGMRKKRKKAK